MRRESWPGPHPAHDRLLLALFALLFLLGAAPAAAQDPTGLLPGDGEAAESGDPAEGDEAGELSTEVDAADDQRIAAALRRRYAEVDGLTQVQVDVQAGVVTLTGEVLTLEAVERAEQIARRTAGVAEVDEQIDQVTNVTERVVPVLQRAKDRLWELASLTPLLVVSLLVIVAFAWVGRWLAARDGIFRRIADTAFVRDLLRQLVRVVFLLAGLLIALDLLGATALVGAVLGTAGVVGLAIGFAFKDLVENYIASVLLSIRQPFAPNDLVEIDGQEGKVVRLTSRATILMTLDGNHLRIPNAQVFKAVILNYTRNPLRRFHFGVGVGVDEDLVEAQELGHEVMRGMEGVTNEPEPWSRVEELGDSNVLVRFFGWVDQRQHDFQKVKSATIRRVKTALDDAGIDMPEPIYRVHMIQAGSLEAKGETPPQRSESTDPVVEDLTADTTIDRQIAEDRARSDEDDLLTDDAPLEM